MLTKYANEAETSLYNTIHSRHSDTPHTMWSAIDRTVDWARPHRKSIAIDACQKYAHDICRKNSK